MARWAVNAASRSVGPFCLTQLTSSPLGFNLVCGRKKTLVRRPFLLVSSHTFFKVMCSLGLKLSRW